MKLLLLLLVSVSLFAQQKTFKYTASATGASTPVQTSTDIHTVQIVGTTTTCTFNLEASEDGTNFEAMNASPMSCAAHGMFSFVTPVTLWVRVNVLTFSGASVVITYRGTGK
jgi:hypothetical protein